MGLLDRFRRAKNLTREWVGDPAIQLELDFDRDTLNGTGLGGWIRGLSFLGPGHVDRTGSRYEFRDRGIVLETKTCGGEEIESIFVVPIPDVYFPKLAPYSGAVRVGGRAVSLSELVGEADVVAAFGEPTRRDRDDQETVLFYELGPVERQIELTPEGRIKTLALFALD
jgi:hypothetical protein